MELKEDDIEPDRMGSHADERRSVELGLDAPAYQLRKVRRRWSIGSEAMAIVYNSARQDVPGCADSDMCRARVGADTCATVDDTAGGAGGGMTWEWEHRNNRGQWTLTVGNWHAVVQRVAGSRPMWQATLMRATPPHDHYASQVYPEAVDARTWCLRKISELAEGAP